jgi:hypothetical protein
MELHEQQQAISSGIRVAGEGLRGNAFAGGCILGNDRRRLRRSKVETIEDWLEGDRNNFLRAILLQRIADLDLLRGCRRTRCYEETKNREINLQWRLTMRWYSITTLI